MDGSFGRLNVREDDETCISQYSFVLEKIDILITQANLQKAAALGPAALLRRASTWTPQTFNQRGNVFTMNNDPGFVPKSSSRSAAISSSV